MSKEAKNPKSPAAPAKRSAKSSTEAKPEKEPAPAAPTPEMAALLSILTPLLDFHKKVEDAGSNDVRMYWDVRVVRGADEHLASQKGSTTLPGLLHPDNLHQACAIISGEVISKIAQPLGMTLQDYTNQVALDVPEKEVAKIANNERQNLPAPSGPIPDDPSGKDTVDGFLGEFGGEQELEGEEPEGVVLNDRAGPPVEEEERED